MKPIFLLIITSICCHAASIDWAEIYDKRGDIYIQQRTELLAEEAFIQACETMLAKQPENILARALLLRGQNDALVAAYDRSIGAFADPVAGGESIDEQIVDFGEVDQEVRERVEIFAPPEWKNFSFVDFQSLLLEDLVFNPRGLNANQRWWLCTAYIWNMPTTKEDVLYWISYLTGGFDGPRYRTLAQRWQGSLLVAQRQFALKLLADDDLRVGLLAHQPGAEATESLKVAAEQDGVVGTLAGLSVAARPQRSQVHLPRGPDADWLFDWLQRAKDPRKDLVRSIVSSIGENVNLADALMLDVPLLRRAAKQAGITD